MRKISLILFIGFISLFATHEAEAQDATIQVGSGVNNATAYFAIFSTGDSEIRTCPPCWCICQWFPDFQANEPAGGGQTLGVQIIHDGTNPLPFEIHLTADASSYGIPYDVFKVKQDITFDAEPGSPFSTVLTEAGNYPFNSSLGSYGGFEIPVIGL